MPQAPDEIVATFPPNAMHFIHLYPRDHPALYCSSWATLNVTRDAMVRYGWSPSVRLFEAAACGACIISDRWAGIEDVLEPGREILLAETTEEMVAHIQALTAERRTQIGAAARAKVLCAHSYDVRATQFEQAFARVQRGSATAAAR
jgi:spore maturation protein CgeB